MKKNNDYASKTTWRIWLIKKLLTNDINKDDIFKILGENSDLNINKNNGY